MELSSLKPGERMVDIVHPKTKEPTGLTVNLLSINDDRMKDIRRKIIDQRLILERKGKNFKSTELEDNESTMLFNAMLGWDWGCAPVKAGEKTGDPVLFHGEKPEFNRKNVMAVLNELAWVKTQLLEAIGDEEAFF